MNTKVFAFPQGPSLLSKVNLYQDPSTKNLSEPHDHPINTSTNKPQKTSSVPAFQSRPHFTTVLLNKASKAGPELNLDIQHLGGGSKKPLLNITTEIPFENLGIPHSKISRMTVTRGQNNNSNKVSLPNLNLTMTSVNHAAPKTVFEMFKNLMDPMNEIRGIEGVKLKEKEVKPVVASHRPFTRKNTGQNLENSMAEQSLKKVMPLVLNETFRKENERKSNKLTKRSNTGSFSQDEDDDTELQTAQIFRHHMEENGRAKVQSLTNITHIDNLHFRKKIRKIFKSQGAKDSHRSIDDHLNTTTSQNDTSINPVNKRELKRGVSNSHNVLPPAATEDSLQGWNHIRPVRIVSGKSVRSDSHQPVKQNFAIKTYKDGVVKSKKRVVTCVTEFDVKIAKIFKNHRTLEQNILSPLNESSSSEDDNFAEYVEAIKSEGALRCT